MPFLLLKACFRAHVCTRGNIAKRVVKVNVLASGRKSDYFTRASSPFWGDSFSSYPERSAARLAHLLGVQGVAGSNPAVPTDHFTKDRL